LAMPIFFASVICRLWGIPQASHRAHHLLESPERIRSQMNR
jgi:hypothetical protein